MQLPGLARGANKQWTLLRNTAATAVLHGATRAEVLGGVAVPQE
jgi:hypothetical protein